MMKRIFLATTATITASAFMSDVEPVVMVGGVRVSKSAYDADQEKPEGEREYGKLDSKAKQADVEQSQGGIALNTDGPPLAAPSAPDFTGGEGAAPLPVDPLKNAVAPVAPGPNSRAVLKKGKKYHAVDANTGETLKLDGIEPTGYDTEDAAWVAIRALPH